jgi:signal transduction histidine kinase
MRGEPIAWGQPFAIWLAWGYAWAMLTPPILWLAARFPLERPHIARAAAVHTAASAVAVALNLGLFAVAAPFVGATSTAETWLATFSTLLGSTFFLDLPAYWAVVVAAQTIRFARTARERERRALMAEARLAEARLLALRAQLQPHFLFNALNTVSVLMREDVDAADRVLVLLSGLLRRTLEAPEAHEVALRDEVAFLEIYLEIERTRFADRLSYRVDVDPDVLDARGPSLILQPLVENAIRHGVARRASPGQVEVAAGRRDGMVHMTVRDDGPGMAPGATDGVGLSNTRARLEQLYGGDHRLRLAGAEGGGLVVSLAIPYRTAGAS